MNGFKDNKYHREIWSGGKCIGHEIYAVETWAFGGMTRTTRGPAGEHTEEIDQCGDAFTILCYFVAHLMDRVKTLETLQGIKDL